MHPSKIIYTLFFVMISVFEIFAKSDEIKFDDIKINKTFKKLEKNKGESN